MANLIRFFFDQHIPQAVAIGLRDRGVDVLTAQESNGCGLTDEKQLRFAAREGRVVVTFDPDFLRLDARGIEHAGLAWCQSEKCSIGQLIAALILLHGVLDAEEMCNHVEYL